MVQSLGIRKLVSQIAGTWATSDKQWKVQKKSKKLMGFCPKKYIPSPYTVDLSNITFNYLCVDSPSYLCQFWNHKSFFTTQILCIFLVQTLHTFYKSCPWKSKFSDFPLLKVHQIPHVIFQIKSQFFFKV